jgi:HD-GYP domain-containing protein (c-di-GMP phosphodiesterase class II)/DNA-binding CsgD family transcriptional regulator
VRLLDFAVALSVGTDLGNGQPPETAMRITRRALWLADALVEPIDKAAVLWAGLLRFAGCVSTSPEEASFGGDDLALRSALLYTDLANPSDVVVHLGSGRYVPQGAGPIDLAGFAERGPQLAPLVLRSHCEVAVTLARRLGLPDEVQAAIGSYHERYDGSGPYGQRGEEVPPVSRLLAVAQGLELHRGHPPEERRAILLARSGSWYDPQMVKAALREDPLDGSPWAALAAIDAAAPRTVEDVRELLPVLGDWADLKAPCFAGHSRAVARTVTALARSEGEDAALLAAAAAVHDLGRVGVPNGVWGHPGPLDPAQAQQMRTHVAVASEILGRIPSLSAVRRLVALHHERLDGSGYPSGLDGASIPRPARLLAAADVWVSLRQPRPHRPALGEDEATRVLRAEASDGRLDPRAVGAVLDAAGLEVPPPVLPAGLSEREVEVLGLVARGLTNKEVGAALALSPRTVQQHTLRIYRKLGVSTRAAAGLFAAEHGLV